MWVIIIGSLKYFLMMLYFFCSEQNVALLAYSFLASFSKVSFDDLRRKVERNQVVLVHSHGLIILAPDVILIALEAVPSR